VIADETRGFDHISAGYHGPRTFPVLVREGSRLSQIRFGRGNALLDGETLRALHARERLVTVGVDLSGLGPRWHGRLPRQTSQRLIDVERRAGCDVADFWEPMHSRKERNLILDPREFYILAWKEAVPVLPDYSAEMVPFDPLVGEFRVYYAGSSATRAPAGAARARCWRCVRAKCRSSSSTEEPKQFVA